MNDLNIPSFDDFLDEMSDGRSQRWADDALKEVMRNIGISFDPRNPEDVERLVQATFALGQRATIHMLRDYHDWLCRQLGSKSLRLI